MLFSLHVSMFPVIMLRAIPFLFIAFRFKTVLLPTDSYLVLWSLVTFMLEWPIIKDSIWNGWPSHPQELEHSATAFHDQFHPLLRSISVLKYDQLQTVKQLPSSQE